MTGEVGSANPETGIEVGDQAAAAGDWVEAIAAWERLLDTDEGPGATQRIRWFLAEAAPNGAVRSRTRPDRDHRRWLLPLAVVSGVAGTACVFAAQEVPGSAGIVLAGVAWLLYIAAATLAVASAFGTSRSPAPDAIHLQEAELLQARELASCLSSSGRDGVPDV